MVRLTRSSVAAFCEFCARQTNPADGCPLCDRCLAEMKDPQFAQAVARALPAESRAALRRLMNLRAEGVDVGLEDLDGPAAPERA